MTNTRTRPVKYIFVTGGVVSSLGKGLAAASIGALLEGHGYKVTLQKFDPYINVDPGTMSPYQHGEVYVTDDGAETDLDLGHYERFTNMQRRATATGPPARSTCRSSRKSGAATTSAAPFRSFRTSPTRSRTASARCRRDVDIVLVEIGGTVGDIESLPFLEAIRQFRQDVGRDNTLYIHLTLVPFIGAAGELKTKPTQHSVRDLRSIGIQPDILLCRTDRFLDADIKQKIALFCDVDRRSGHHGEGRVDDLRSAARARRRGPRPDRAEASRPAADREAHGSVGRARRAHQEPEGRVTIHVVGKYAGYEDSYKSLNEALYHGGFAHRLKVDINWVEAEALEQPGGEQLLDGADGILVPGGFGTRGTRGMMKAAEIAREQRHPVLRHLLRLPVGDRRIRAQRLRARPRRIPPKSTRRAAQGDLQAARPARRRRSRRHDAARQYECELAPGSLAHEIYGATVIHERHRHRYEFNCLYEQTLTDKGLRVSGRSPDGKFVEIVELPGHPWFIAVQFHPEFKSKPLQAASAVRELRRGRHQHKTRPSGQRDRRRPASPDGTPCKPRHRPEPSPSAAALPLALIAGPCVIESEAHASMIAPSARDDRRRAAACRSSSRRRSTRPTARR